jgi:TolB-like protein/Flp pilus assembly protein TadD
LHALGAFDLRRGILAHKPQKGSKTTENASDLRHDQLLAERECRPRSDLWRRQQRVRDLFEELRSRSVIRALIAYSVVAWILLQVADVTFDRLPIPENSMTVLIVLVIVGFPVTAIFAWAYEITARGIVRHDEASVGTTRLAFVPFIAIVMGVTAGAGGLIYYLSQQFYEPPRRSIAVLPFTNTGNAEHTGYFSDGLTEEIQSLIVRLNEFRVVALSTTSQFKDTVMDAVSIAERVGAEAVLLGSVRRYQNKVSVTARLIDGDDGGELWSDTYDRELSNIYDIQEDIARHVARALHVVLPISAERRFKNLGTGNVEAYDAYLRGIDYLRKPKDETTLLLAEGMLREALAIDPGFSDAQAAMCRKQLLSYELSQDPERFGDAERDCHKALESDEKSARVRLALGQLYFASGKYENAVHEFEAALDDNGSLADAYIGLSRTQAALGRDAQAEANLRRAIEADVSYWLSFNTMGYFLFRQGRFAEAAEFFQMFVSRADDDAQALNNLGAAYYLSGAFRRAASAWDDSLAIKPTRSAYSNTGTMYFYVGDYQRAIERYVNAANMAPNDYKMWGNLADAYFFQGSQKQVADVSYKRAIDLAEKLLAINADDSLVMSDLALYYSRIGNVEKAREFEARVNARGEDAMYMHYNSALIHAQFGETEAALAALERAVELNYQRELLSVDPAFEEFKNDERFRQLVGNSSS